MKTMILAAGRGQRMRPLTDHTPKPLLPVGGQPLITWHLKRLAAAGLHEVVINHAWLGEQIEATLGDGRQWGVSITYSPEATALETAGGIAHAMPLLGNDPFLVINADIWCDWPLERALAIARQWRATIDASPALAHLVLVANPTHHPDGDFAIDDQGQLSALSHPRLTYAGLGVYQPALFKGLTAKRLAPGAAPLGPLLKAAMANGQISGEVHQGQWIDIGTPDRLARLDEQINRANLQPSTTRR
jgi:MurNAc alpha-1-phosphate uridylyltransferase